jgi:hypothetical protein
LSLREARAEILETLKEQLSVIAGGYPAREVGGVYEEVATCFQAIGCCNMLLRGDAEGFHRNLMWAALTRRTFLARIHAEKSADDFRCARSRCESFFCAIAAGDWLMAREIGDLSPADFMPDGEYEDDFAYYRFVDLLIKGANPAERERTLLRFEAALEGAASPRLDVCKALHAMNADDFEKALRDRIEAHQDFVNEDRVRFADDPTFEPRSRIFIEGLALIKIAEQARIGPTARDLPLCPSIARVNPMRVRPDDIFTEIERAMGR